MKEKERDILAERPELRKMPYRTPEGYFEEFKLNMETRTSRPRRRNFIPYVSAAASVALLVGAGFFLMHRASHADEFTHEDYLVFSSSIINSEYYETEQYADAEIADEDIIDYLIYSGISAEEIEQYK